MCVILLECLCHKLILSIRHFDFLPSFYQYLRICVRDVIGWNGSNCSFILWQVVLNLGSLQNSHEAQISCLGLSADGSALCTGSWDTNLKVIFLRPASVISFRACNVHGKQHFYWYLLIFSAIMNANRSREKVRQCNVKFLLQAAPFLDTWPAKLFFYVWCTYEAFGNLGQIFSSLFYNSQIHKPWRGCSN